ncbi:MAG: hypothetical protein IT521_08575 [Burkholderiales bacterium]|nr:hypothetical protein [Burkholderiales bacterium]
MNNKTQAIDTLSNDYPGLLLSEREPPCLSLYQPTHRQHPDNAQDPIRFRNLLKTMETSLRQRHRTRDVQPLLAPFRALAEDHEFWNHTLDGLAVLGADDLFRVYRLQRPVTEMVVVADSFHTKPLLRVLQSADRYRILGLSRHTARLFEGNRDALAEVALAPNAPQMVADTVADRPGGPERTNRVYGPASVSRGTTRHGTDVRQDALDNDTERFFRDVDHAVITHHSGSDMPLLLAALPEHHHAFRKLSQNPSLADATIDVNPDDLSLDELRKRAWRAIEPGYLQRLGRLTDAFHAARARHLAEDDLVLVARAVADGRVATLLIEAERQIPGRIDTRTGAITRADLNEPDVDDLLDDIGELGMKTGGEVVIVPAARMPTQTGIAATCRF